MTFRKHPSVAFRITVAFVAVLVGYPLSFGPACWITSWTNAGAGSIPKVYRPITWLMVAGDSLTSEMVKAYADVGAAHGWVWYSTVDATGNKAGWEWGKLGLLTIIDC
jgi:hypothetical protein